MTSLYHSDIAALVLEHAASRIHAFSDGLDILRVLPAGEQPATRAAILARGYINPTLAVSLGHTHLLQDFPKGLLLDTRDTILLALCAVGDVDAIIDFSSKYTGPISRGPMTVACLSSFTVTNAATSSGHIPVLEYLVATAAKNNWDTIGRRGRWVMAAQAGHIACLDWALREKYLKLDEFSLEIRAAAMSGQLAVLEWFHQHLLLQDRSYTEQDANAIPRAATEGGHFNILEWWWDNIAAPTLPPPVELVGIVNHALYLGKLDRVLWWWAKFETYRTPDHQFGSHTAALCALQGGSFPVIQWLWAIAARPDASDLLADWDSKPLVTMPNGLLVQSLPLVQWWIEFQLPPGQPLEWTPSHAVVAVRSGAVQVLDLVLALPDQSEVHWGTAMAATALRYRQLRVLEWYLANRARLPDQQHPNVFFDSAEGYKSRIVAIKWWEAHIGFEQVSFLQLGAAIARHCDSDSLEWWLSQLAKPSRGHLVRAALTKTLVDARSVWALELLADAAASYDLAVGNLMANHTCVRSARSIEAVCWWYVLLGGADSPADEWRSVQFGGSSCSECQLLGQGLST
ncbi:hypothetical protein BC828DRAFT_382850 [Blastocladiella britannica]|nr:hypothetical protein BC828DRAFT_382850 [Blastocladiella britannica]